MKSKHAMIAVTVVIFALVALNFAIAGAASNIAVSTQTSGVVLKNRGDSFTVSVTFQNTGSSDGSWTVNVVFEGASWSWKGTAKPLTLNANEKSTLVWTGAVPSNAAVNSIARLVVYYDDGYKALDWWVQVVPNSMLSIQSSSVQ
jgi:hypothetical protein